MLNPNLACNINLLKINFENSINLGGENTHLDSKLRTHSKSCWVDLSTLEPTNSPFTLLGLTRSNHTDSVFAPFSVLLTLPMVAGVVPRCRNRAPTAGGVSVSGF